MSGELVLRHNGVITQAGPFRFTPTGMEVDGEPEYGEWEQVGSFLQKVSGRIQWWIGDWLLYGECRWGETYREAMELTGLEENTLMACQWTASKFEYLRRRNNLPFSSHREVAPLPPAQADEILDIAERDRLSTREVRKLVRELKAGEKPEPVFEPSVERDAILSWLWARRETWPEKFRPTFVGYVIRILDQMEPVDEDDGG